MRKIIEIRTANGQRITINPAAHENKTERKITRIEDDSEHCDSHSFTQYTGYNELNEPVLSFQNCPVMIIYEVSKKEGEDDTN